MQSGRLPRNLDASSGTGLNYSPMTRPGGTVTYAADLIETKLRLPRELRDALRVHADANRRSVNAQIIVLLEQALAEERAVRAVAGILADEERYDVIAEPAS
jgi:hypothetical protein